MSLTEGNRVVDFIMFLIAVPLLLGAMALIIFGTIIDPQRDPRHQVRRYRP